MGERHIARWGSDLVIDLLAEAGVDWVAFNPGATFRGLHDSLVAAGHAPRLALCMHESISVAVAQGYAKAAGRPMAVFLHDIVGLQNAAMAIYNAWCDRVPMLLIGGSGPAAKSNRRPWIDWIHSSADQASLIRDHVKFDDEPRDLASVTESFARGLTTTLAAPAGPVYLCYDVDLQEEMLPDGFVRQSLGAYPRPTSPAAPSAEIERLAAALWSAQAPAFVAGYVADEPDGFADLVAVAEAVGARVLDTWSRLNFPTSHPLNVSALERPLADADLVVVLDVDDPSGVIARTGVQSTATVVNVSPAHLRLRAWSHDYQSLPQVNEHLTSSGGSAIAALRDQFESRSAHPHAPERIETIGELSLAARTDLRTAAAEAECDDAIARSRLIWELGQALRGVDHVLANGTNEREELTLWDLDRPGSYLGWHAGGGLGYGLGAAIGVSLALGPDVVAVDVQADGDLLYLPSALWTAANLSLPVLVVVHNNRLYGNTAGHSAEIARLRGRDNERVRVGSAIDEPAVDLAGLARSFGVWAAGPVTDPDELPTTLHDAVRIVRSGVPALVDVVTG